MTGGGVVLVDMEQGGQAHTKFGLVLSVGMKLMKVNATNVSSATMAHVCHLMSSATRPVLLSWKDTPATTITIKQ